MIRCVSDRVIFPDLSSICVETEALFLSRSKLKLALVYGSRRGSKGTPSKSGVEAPSQKQ